MHVVAAPDKFKGTATARAVAAAVAAAVESFGGTCDPAPVSDGGEGFLDVLGGSNRTTTVNGPLGDPVNAGWRLTRGEAVIEMASASGLQLVGGADGNDVMLASTHGTGELIMAAFEAGARRILLGVGGSATTDGGLGALKAMYPLGRLRGVEIVVGCDVRTLFVESAAIFAPQKGATAAQVDLLTRRLERLLHVFVDEYGVDVGAMEGSGAAGGLAGGLAAIGAELSSGFDIVADSIDLDERIEGADLVVTGEGFLDAESFEGKVVGGVVDLAGQSGVPVLIVVGEAFDVVRETAFGDTPSAVTVLSLTDLFGRERSISDTVGCVTEAVADFLAADHVPG